MLKKKSAVIISLCIGMFLPLISNGQIVTYNNSKLSDHIVQDILTDAVTGTKFILDKKRVYITAISKNGKQLWKTDPVTDNKIQEYRVQRPVVIYFVFGIDNMKKSQVIKIQYNNTQAGYLDKKTGKFTFEGQD